MKLLTEKLKSVRINPQPQHKAVGLQGTAKLTSAIHKGGKGSGKGATSEASQNSVCSDVTVMDARVIRIGPEDSTKTFVANGFVYAALLD